MRYTIVVAILLFITVIVASVFYFTNLNEDLSISSTPASFLPEDSYLVIKFAADESTERLFRDYEIFEALLGKKQSQSLIDIKKQLETQLIINQALKESDVYLSFHEVNKTLLPLFGISLNSKLSTKEYSELSQMLSKSYSLKQLDTLSLTLLNIYDSLTLANFYIGNLKNVVFLSPSLDLISKVLDKNSPKLGKEELRNIDNYSNQKSPIKFVFSHKNINSLNNLFSKRTSGTMMSFFKQLEGYSSWDLNYKSDALILVGESHLDNNEAYFTLFQDQSKTSQYLTDFFPTYTAAYVEFSLSNKALFQERLKDYLSKKGDMTSIRDQHDAIALQDSVDLEASFNSYLGDNFALVEQSNGTLMGFITITDPEEFKESAKHVFSVSSDSLYRFNYSNLLYSYYGDPFYEFSRPFAMILDSVLVVANHTSTLQEFQNLWKRNNLLNGTLEFKNFEKIKSNEANITYFVHTKNSHNLLRRSLKNEINKIYNDKENFGFQDFYSWSFQLSGHQKYFTSNLYGVYKTSSTLGINSEWEYSFKNKPITPPYVYEHSDTSQFILVQELDHTLHAISPNGAKMWSTVLHGRIVGNPIQYQDRTISLVTDKNRLYRFDPDGKATPGYSLLMPSTPISGPQFLTINEHTVIAVPSRVSPMIFKLDGTPLKEWKDIPNKDQPIQNILSDGQHIIIGRNNGNLEFYNAKAKLEKELSPTSPVKVVHDFRQISNTPSEWAYTTIDSSGLILLYGNGLVQTVDSITSKTPSDLLVSFSPEANNTTPYAAIINNNQLEIHNLKDKAETKEISLNVSISNSPQFFITTDNQVKVGVASASNRLLYVFDSSGRLLEGFPIQGMPQFYYGRINYNSGNYILCYRNNHKLYAFKDNFK